MQKEKSTNGKRIRDEENKYENEMNTRQKKTKLNESNNENGNCRWPVNLLRKWKQWKKKY